MAQTAMVEKTVYDVSELSPTAFERAWQKHVENIDHDWWDSVYDDFIQILDLMGFDVKSENVQFSGFYHQGSYAAFSGYYYFKKGASKEIKAYAPNDAELHRIAKELTEMQRKCFYQLSGSFKYSDYYGYSIDMEDGRRNYGWLDAGCDAESVFRDLVKDLSAWLYNKLQEEWEYMTSKEEFIASCEANDYQFNSRGDIDSI